MINPDININLNTVDDHFACIVVYKSKNNIFRTIIIGDDFDRVPITFASPKSHINRWKKSFGEE